MKATQMQPRGQKCVRYKVVPVRTAKSGSGRRCAEFK